MENREIERKFLVRELPPSLDSYPSEAYRQGYLCRHPVVRVRHEGDRFVLTYKGSGSLSHEEYNLPLTEAAFTHLWAKIDGVPVEKRRYRIPYGAYTIELDLFEGRHSGLALAEVEFDSVEEALAFTPPAWLGADVTEDKRFRNASLSEGGPLPQEGILRS